MRLSPVLVHLGLAGLIGLVALAVGAPPASATVVVFPALDEMARGADVIARVRVGERRVVREEGRIMTYTAVVVTDALKGTKDGDRLEISQLGGELDGKSSWIVGAHRFTKDEDLILFAQRLPEVGPGVVVPWGIGVGLFRVEPELTGEKVVELFGDVALVEVGPDGRHHAVTPRARRFDSMPAFKEALARILRGAELPTMPMKKKLGPGFEEQARPAVEAKPKRGE
jgi:hypothetical protein